MQVCRKRVLFSRTAANGTAEEGSTTIFIRSHISCMAATMLSSEQVITSTFFCVNISNVKGDNAVLNPSASVGWLKGGCN